MFKHKSNLLIITLEQARHDIARWLSGSFVSDPNRLTEAIYRGVLDSSVPDIPRMKYNDVVHYYRKNSVGELYRLTPEIEKYDLAIALTETNLEIVYSFAQKEKE